MNLKLNNDCLSSQRIIVKKPVSAIKEERRRTGRYIAILVGISLFLLAMYHAWVRRIPIVASLVVPALIMFIYVAWVLYTASKDKHRLLDAEAALQAAALESENEAQYFEQTQNNMDTSVSRDSKLNSPEGCVHKNWTEIVENRNRADTDSRFLTPLILINDELPEDLDQKWTHVVQILTNSGKLKGFPVRKRHKRKFCRRKHAVFKRSYSIA